MPRTLRAVRPPQPTHDLWPVRLSLGDKLQRLTLLAPETLEAIEILVDEALAVRWPARVVKVKIRHSSILE